MIKNELLREAGENIEYNKKQILEFARCRQDIFTLLKNILKQEMLKQVKLQILNFTLTRRKL